MRNILLTSTAAVCLLLAGQVANAQSDQQKKDEIKKEQVQHQKRDHQVQQQQDRRSTTGQTADEKKNEPSKADTTKSDTTKSDTNKGAASSSENKDQNAATKPSTDTNKSAQSEKSKRDETKKSAEEQKQNATPSKSTASEQNKANQSTKPSTAEAPKSSTTKQENASTPNSNTNATNNTTNKNSTTNKATTTNTANQAQPSSKTSAAQLDPQKKVEISETFAKQRDLAPPVRNTNISITVGQRVPRNITLHRLPREIVTIAPEYRDYEYFTTEEDVVIVSPRTHEIVTEIPRDASRARAEVSGGSSTAVSSSTSGGAMPCQVMQRTASGDTKPIDPAQLRQTTGSGGKSDRLAVRVQAPNGQQMPEVTLPDREGRIIAEANGSDCRIILEPGQVGR